VPTARLHARLPRPPLLLRRPGTNARRPCQFIIPFKCKHHNARACVCRPCRRRGSRWR
jgi:hypothetical protein